MLLLIKNCKNHSAPDPLASGGWRFVPNPQRPPEAGYNPANPFALKIPGCITANTSLFKNFLLKPNRKTFVNLCVSKE